MADLLTAFAAPLRLVHILVGLLLAAGLLGRWVALAYAERAARESELSGVQALLGASGVFERIVVVSSQVVLVLGLLAAWSLGYPLLGFLQGATSNWLLVSLVLYASVAVLIPTVFVPKSRTFDAALEGSLADGRTTPALVAAFADPTIRAAHIYEAGAVLSVLVLMILKPF